MDLRDEVRPYDRRRHARVVKDIYTVYAAHDPYEEGLFKTENISGAGILFKSRNSFTIGAQLTLNIHLPDHVNPIPCEATVVRNISLSGEGASFNVGLAFTRITEKDKKDLIGNLFTQDDFYLFL